jgi:hypothetical protein
MIHTCLSSMYFSMYLFKEEYSIWKRPTLFCSRLTWVQHPPHPLPTTADTAPMAHFPKWGIFGFFQYFIQHCFICRPSDSSESEDAGIEPRTVVTSALAVRRSNHSAGSHPHQFPSLILLLISVQQIREWGGPKADDSKKSWDSSL